ncbi:MAG TPA: POTRA domain-containing protein [Edaphobacter sp.]|nr:POTRA domain-containing protein [Edaphobacter sp.]
MRMLVRVLVVSLVAKAGLGQPCPNELARCVRINKLVIESNSLPDADRERIVRSFQQKRYPEDVDEFRERIRQALRDLGYFKAAVDEPTFAFPTKGRAIANVTANVKPGALYRLGEIRFHKASVFPVAQLRDLFSQREGDFFNATEFSKGLYDLRKLYSTRGFVNMVAAPVPSIDESRRIINLLLEVDEGEAYDFGRLYLQGVEPYPGAGKALLDSWKPLEGKRFNTLELERWLQANHSEWKVGTQASRWIKIGPDGRSRVVDVTLTQWPLWGVDFVCVGCREAAGEGK